MAKAAQESRKEKLAYAKEMLAAGTRRVADIQKAVKAKFGAGMDFRDIGKIYPKKRGAARKAPKRGQRAAAKAAAHKPAAAHGGRVKGVAADQWVLFVGNEGEVFGSRRRLADRIGALVRQGASPDTLAIYEKTSMTVPVKMTLSL